MDTLVLPDGLLRGTAVLIFTLAVVLVTVHTVLATLAAQRSPAAPRVRALAPAAVGVFLATWLGVALATGDHANFPLVRSELRLPISLIVGFGPMFAAIAWLFSSKTLRQLNAAMPPTWLIWVQTYRMAGLMFLYPFLYYGMLPAGFAIPAAAGDFLLGVTAPFVALAIARGRPNAFAWAMVWNVAGVLDLIVAPTAAFLSDAQVFTVYPLALVPLFVGPPLGILTHVYSLRNLAVARTRTVEEHLSSAGNFTMHEAPLKG